MHKNDCNYKELQSLNLQSAFLTHVISGYMAVPFSDLWMCFVFCSEFSFNSETLISMPFLCNHTCRVKNLFFLASRFFFILLVTRGHRKKTQFFLQCLRSRSLEITYSKAGLSYSGNLLLLWSINHMGWYGWSALNKHSRFRVCNSLWYDIF